MTIRSRSCAAPLVVVSPTGGRLQGASRYAWASTSGPSSPSKSVRCAFAFSTARSPRSSWVSTGQSSAGTSQG